MNQNPEQLARYQIDTALIRCGWVVHVNRNAIEQIRISRSDINEIQIASTSISDPQNIFLRLENRIDASDKKEESMYRGLLQAEAFRQSILKKVFEGKLIQ